MYIKIKKNICEFVKEYDNDLKEICFSVDRKEKSDELGRDIRLLDENYSKDAITIQATLNKTILAETTLYIVDDTIYNQIWFWKKQKKKYMLEKINMKALKIIQGGPCVIFAYTEINSIVRKSVTLSYRAELLKFYLGLCKYIMNKLNVFCYMEPTGILYIDDEKRKEQQIMLSQTEYEKLGNVHQDSIVAEKVAKKIGMTELKDIYHCITGGKIYYSKNSLIKKNMKEDSE